MINRTIQNALTLLKFYKSPRLLSHLSNEYVAILSIFTIVTMSYFPSIFFGLYFRDEGRLLTLASLFWQGNYPFPETPMALSFFLAGGWLKLTSSLGLAGARLGATLCSGTMAALCFPLVRRFMSAPLAVLSLIGTAVVVNYSYVNFVGYRNIPALFIYLAIYCFSKYYFGSYSSRIYWLLAGSVALGLSVAAWISSLVGFAIPLLLMISELWGSNKKERLLIVAKWLFILLLATLFWQLTAWLLGLHLQEVEPGQPISDLRHHLSFVLLYEHSLKILGIYAISFSKSITISVKFIILSSLVLGSWHASSRKMFYAVLLLIIVSYFFFGKYLAFFISFCALVSWPRQLPWWVWVGKIAVLFVAYKFLGQQIVWIMAIVYLATIISNPSPWLKSLIWGGLIFGASQIVGIKYWHIPFVFCIFLAGLRIAVAKISGVKISRAYITWLAVAVVGGLATMLGSIVGPKKVEAALWLLLPLALFANPDETLPESKSNTHKIFSNLIPVMLGIVFAMSLNSLSIKSEYESGFWLLKSRVNAPKLGLIWTTPGRAKSTTDLMKTLSKLKLTQDDYILAYNNIPLIYYLTETQPYLDEPWIDVMSPQWIEKKLEIRSKEGKFPRVVVRALADTRERNWGHKNTLYSPKGTQLKIRKIFDKWTNNQRFRVYWENKDFQVLTRQ